MQQVPDDALLGGGLDHASTSMPLSRHVAAPFGWLRLVDRGGRQVGGVAARADARAGRLPIVAGAGPAGSGPAAVPAGWRTSELPIGTVAILAGTSIVAVLHDDDAAIDHARRAVAPPPGRLSRTARHRWQTGPDQDLRPRVVLRRWVGSNDRSSGPTSG